MIQEANISPSHTRAQRWPRSPRTDISAAAVKEEFAARAGLIREDRILTQEEAGELFKSAAYTHDNREAMTYAEEQQFLFLMEKLQDRMANVVFENQDFEALIRHYDRPDSFFYADPPYLAAEDSACVRGSESRCSQPPHCQCSAQRE